MQDVRQHSGRAEVHCECRDQCETSPLCKPGAMLGISFFSVCFVVRVAIWRRCSSCLTWGSSDRTHTDQTKWVSLFGIHPMLPVSDGSLYSSPRLPPYTFRKSLTFSVVRFKTTGWQLKRWPCNIGTPLVCFTQDPWTATRLSCLFLFGGERYYSPTFLYH